MARLALALALTLLVGTCHGAGINGSISIHDGTNYPYIMLSQLPPGAGPRGDEFHNKFLRRVWFDNDQTLQNNSILIKNIYEAGLFPGMFYANYDEEWVMVELESISGFPGISGEGFARLSFDGTILKTWYKAAGTFVAYNTGSSPEGFLAELAPTSATEWLAVRIVSTSAEPNAKNQFSEDPSGSSTDLRVVFSDTSESHSNTEATGSLLRRSNGNLITYGYKWGSVRDFKHREYTISGDTLASIHSYSYYKGHTQKWGNYAAFENSNGTMTIAVSTQSGASIFGWEGVGGADAFICEAEGVGSTSSMNYFKRCTSYGSYGEETPPTMAHDPLNQTVYLATRIGMDIDMNGPRRYYDKDPAIFALDYHSHTLKWSTVFGKTSSGNDMIGHMVASKTHIYFTLDGKLVQYPICDPGQATGWDMDKNEHVYCLPCSGGQKYYGQNECGPCPVGEYSPVDAGGQTFVDCIKCPAGYHAQNEGSSECTPCGPGYFSLEGAEFCVECPVGSLTTSTASTACDLCPGNTWGNTTGATSCNPCPYNSVSPPGSSSANSCNCNSGYFGDLAKGEKCKCVLGVDTMVQQQLMYFRECPPLHATCFYGSKIPSYDYGYWASEDDPYRILECLPEVACPGGASYSSCADGYTGESCGECAENYYRSDGYCRFCSVGKAGPLLVAGIALLTGVCLVPLLAIGCLLYGHLAHNRMVAMFVRLIRRFWSALVRISKFSQILTVVLATNVKWPLPFQTLLSVTTVFNMSLEMLQFGCAVSGTSFTVFMYHIKILIPLLFVLLGVSGLGLLIVLNAVIRRKKLDAFISYCVSRGILVISFLYVYLSSTSVGLFACFSKSDGSYIWQQSAEVQCYSGAWMAMVPVSLLGVVVFSLGIPLAYFSLTITMWRFKHRPVIMERFHVLWRQYDDEAYWWESVSFLFRLSISASAMWLVAGPMEQLCFIMICTTSYAAFFFLMKPLKSSVEDLLECLMMAVLSFTVLIGMFAELEKMEVEIYASWVLSVMTMYPFVLAALVAYVTVPLFSFVSAKCRCQKQTKQ